MQAKITAALESAKSGAAKISALKQQLDSYNDFYVGLNQYTAGAVSYTHLGNVHTFHQFPVACNDRKSRDK